MTLTEVLALAETVATLDPACRDHGALIGAVGASARLRAWLDGRDAALAAQLAEVAAFPEQELAAAGRVPRRDADRRLERGRTLEAVPALRAALAAGESSGAHVDVIGRALRQLEPHQRPELIARSGTLVELARQSNPDEFSRVMAAQVRQIQADDGMTALERQKRATRARSWIDRDGMWCLSGRFDPETGLRLHSRISAAMDATFADEAPEACPSDPIERQGFLRARALASLIEGTNPVAGRGLEIVVVMDTTAPDATSAPTLDWGLPVELPMDVLRRWFQQAGAGPVVTPVILHGGLVVHAPGAINLGRATRLANRAQRRALRGLYPTCAMPGCDVRFELCRLHHVVWWEHGGATDLDNLLPLCWRHHRAVHELGWRIKLTADRRLTVTFPDGTSQSAGRPRRNRDDLAGRLPTELHDRSPETVRRT